MDRCIDVFHELDSFFFLVQELGILEEELVGRDIGKVKDLTLFIVVF